MRSGSPEPRSIVVGGHRPGISSPARRPARALSEKERDKVFDTLCSERFVDRSPAEVVATLFDEDVYLCSERTMYRVLASQVPVRERRAQRSHPEYQKPELMATGPGQAWSWDITRLLGPRKWSYFYLYVIMGHLQPLHRGMDGGGSGELGLGWAPDPAELPEAWRPAPGPDLALGSRSSDDEPMHGSAPRRSRGDPEPVNDNGTLYGIN